MSKSKLVRAGLLGSAAAFALLGAGTAQAVEAQFGEVQIIFDTTVSAGASMKTADRNTDFLNEANGGPVDARGNPALGGTPIANYNNTIGTFGGAVGWNSGLSPNAFGSEFFHFEKPNYDGSLNADDGRLNFDNGDLIGANVKANHDLQIKWRNYTIFARAVGFYDVIMNNSDAGNRSELLDQALGDVGRNYELLDAFISADYTIADMPVNLRVGKQVINWGESTFILGGNNVFNPIDVGAFRRPGSEIKEALLPVNAVFGSISLPFDVSLSGYYALDWEPFEIDPSGTPFSGADVVTLGSGLGGNEQRGSFLTGSPFSGQRRNCTAAATSGTKLVQTFDFDPGAGVRTLLPNPLSPTAAIGNNKLECSDSPFVNYQVPYTIGNHELVRWNLTRTLANDGVTQKTQAILFRGDDTFARDDGQYGISARWYAESLGGTEFGFYYQNYHSRLPFVSEAFHGGTAELSYFMQGDNTPTTGIGGRALGPVGCGYSSAANIGLIQVLPTDGAVAVATKRVTAGIIATGALNGLIPPAQINFMKTTAVSDPGGIIANWAAGGATSIAAQHGLTLHDAGGTIGINNIYNVMQMNCILQYYQAGVAGAPANTVQSLNGSEILVASGGLDVTLEYPEDIGVLGFSFNTTLWGWGLQGDFTYRDNAPFQVDTDSLTIAALVRGCTFNMLDGLAGPNILAPLAGPDATGIKRGCGDVGNGRIEGVIRNQMYTGQIGTTATFTASDWFIDLIGADLGVLVTEVGYAVVPGVEDTWIDKFPARPSFPNPPVAGVIYKDMVTQYQNIGCQGTDLPAGGFLALDPKSSNQCRPTDFSAGGVLLFRWEYSNAFDSGWVLAPQIVYAYDFMGKTPAPYSTYLEDRQSIGLSLTGTLNNNLRLGASYSNFFGGHVQNKSRDQDFASFSASYTF